MQSSYLPEELLNEVQELIRHNEIKKALDQLNNYFKVSSNSFNKHITMLLSRWQGLNSKVINGMISFPEEVRMENEIKSHLIDFISGFPTGEEIKGKPLERSAFLKIFNSEEDVWGNLEKICVDAVLIGGVTAMSYYRDAWDISKAVSGESKNASMLADFQSTIGILRSLDSRLPDLAERLNCELSYFGEETTDELINMAESNLSERARNSIIYDQRKFFKPSENSIRVIFDAIDGTSNFNRGISLFCSGVAIIIDNVARVSAIYDPVHHVVYSAVLKGPDKNPARSAHAYAWHISSGNREDLQVKVNEINNKYTDPQAETVGIHLTRNSKKRHILRDFLGLGAYGFSASSYSAMQKKELSNATFRMIKSLFEDDSKVYSYDKLLTKIEKKVGENLSSGDLTKILDSALNSTTATYNFVEQLSINTGGIFALNSGLFALAEISRGALGSFVNPVTNPWDVTAGEVLIKAINGKVTDLNGDLIDYSKPGPISVVASRTEGIYQHLRKVLKIQD